jgi:hypothetical protein
VRLSRRTSRRLLWVLALAPLVGVAVCVYSVASQLPQDESAAMEAAAQAKRPNLAAPVTVEAMGPLSDYAAIWQRNLRQPLVDVAVVAAPKAALNVTLIGTAVEPGDSSGIFRDAAGQVHWVKVGQTIGGAKVTAIDETSATLEFGGAPVTLTITKGQGRP